MRKEIEAIYIDVDDCLWPSKGQISADFYSGLERIHQYVEKIETKNFPKIGLCTGRDRNFNEAILLILGPPDSFSIIEHGIALFNARTKELIFHPALTKKKQGVFKKIRQKIVPRILEKYGGLDYPGNLICVDLELGRAPTYKEIEAYYQKVREEISDYLNLVNIAYSSNAVSIIPKGISKAEGMKFMAESTKINLKNVVGIGDAPNDFSWLSLIGQVACPNNAGDECKDFVKKRNGYISLFDFATGVADIIHHFVEEG